MSLVMPKSCLKFTANQTSLLWQMVKMMLWWTLAWKKQSQKRAYAERVLSSDGVSEIHPADIELKSLWRAFCTICQGLWDKSRWHCSSPVDTTWLQTQFCTKAAGKKTPEVTPCYNIKIQTSNFWCLFFLHSYYLCMIITELSHIW